VLGTLIDSERAAERIKARLGFMPQGSACTCTRAVRSREHRLLRASAAGAGAALAARKARLLAITRLERFRDGR